MKTQGIIAEPLPVTGARRISQDEKQAMLGAVTGLALPWDFEQKLARLAKGDLRDSAIEHSCRLYFSLLRAAAVDGFTLKPESIDHLATVLAYVRKEDDLIPDWLPGGFSDDYLEVRAANAAMAGLLQDYKIWRLRHQVPGLWAPRVL